MGKYVFLLAIAVLISVNMAYAEECNSSDERQITLYNSEHLTAIFGSAPVCENGLVHIKTTIGEGRTAREWDIGWLYGNIETREGSKSISVKEGGFIGKDTSVQKDPNYDMKINITGKEFLIDASRQNMLMFSLSDAVYARDNYFFACSEECSMAAMINRTSSYLNVRGKAQIIFITFLDDYLNGRPIAEIMRTGISDLSEIEIQNMSYITLAAKTGERSLFGNVEVHSGEKIKLRRYYSSELNPVRGEKTTAAYTDVVFAENADIFGKSGNFGAALGSAGNVNIHINNENLFTIKRGAMLFFENENIYEQCTMGSIVDVKLNKAVCAYANKIQQKIRLKPWRAEETAGRESPFNILLKYPALSSYNSLEIKDFERDDEDSIITISKQDIPGKEMAFTRDDISVNEGTNWYDFETNFKAYIFDPEKNDYSKFECWLPTKTCYLDDTLVSGFQRISASNRQRCRTDSECGDGQKCQARVCVKKAECEPVELYGGLDSSRAIDVVIISDQYENKAEFLSDANKVIRGDALKGIGILTIEPFKTNAHKFKFHTISTIGTIPRTEQLSWGNSEVMSTSYINQLARACPYLDTSMVLTKRNLRSFGEFNGNAMISMTSEPDLSTYIAVHEFGHSFGELKDEYENSPEGQAGGCNSGKPNCLSVEVARSLWGNELAEEAIANNWRGCGGDCSGFYSRALRPSNNSIMRNYLEEGGDVFNPPSEKWLQDKIDKF